MFSAEDGAWKIIDAAVEKYENHFDAIFPVYEYTEITSTIDYDFSLKGAKRLSAFIDEQIRRNSPVEVPKDYENRVY